MFSKISRYRKLPNVVAPDAEGRQLPSRELRLLPTVTGSYLHTVSMGDRLDQLANEYYSQPLQWWNIADANPTFLSPLALLGDDAVITTRFTVSVSATLPSSGLFATLQAVVGVESASVEEDVQLVQQQVTVAGQTISAWVERTTWVVVVAYNKVNVTAHALISAIETAGLPVTALADMNQVGQEIVIPPKPIG
ncbi:MAG: hypothetical protein WBW33_08285 [Bryobacteraceae bacterium]